MLFKKFIPGAALMIVVLVVVLAVICLIGSMRQSTQPPRASSVNMPGLNIYTEGQKREAQTQHYALYWWDEDGRHHMDIKPNEWTTFRGELIELSVE